MNKRRIGRFFIARHFMEDDDTLVEAFYLLRVVILRAEFMYHVGKMEYVGYSPKFDEVPDGITETDYDIIIHNDSGGLTVEVKRKDMK